MSLLNHSVFPLFVISPLATFFWKQHRPFTQLTLLALLFRPGQPTTVGWRAGKKEKATHEVRVGFFFLHPSRVTTAPLCVKGTRHGCGQAANPPSQFSHSHFTINFFPKVHRVFLLYANEFGRNMKPKCIC